MSERVTGGCGDTETKSRGRRITMVVREEKSERRSASTRALAASLCEQERLFEKRRLVAPGRETTGRHDIH